MDGWRLCSLFMLMTILLCGFFLLTRSVDVVVARSIYIYYNIRTSFNAANNGGLEEKKTVS